MDIMFDWVMKVGVVVYIVVGIEVAPLIGAEVVVDGRLYFLFAAR